jgi:CRP-like cAMP-binding protein
MLLSGPTAFEEIPLFANLSPQDREWVASYFARYQAAVGTLIFAQKASADYFYLLLSGEVLVRFKPYDGEELTIARIQPGSVFGWSAALGNPNYTASAVSTGESYMLRMRGADLRQICRQNPELGAQVLELLAQAAGERLKDAKTQVFALLEYGVCNSA